MKVVPQTEFKRLSIRIPTALNDWLDERTYITGIPKSTLIYMALETYQRQEDVFKSLPDVSKLVRYLKSSETKENI